MTELRDTICAIATPPGEGGIGVIRLSGPGAIPLAARFFRGGKPETSPSHRILYGKFVDPASGKSVDEILCAVMRAPRSYTGEDVVEISAHGNPRLLERILHLLIRAGARHAERGEFTKRAFLNGRLDLTQAESVIDLVKAKTAPGMDAALAQLEGKLGKHLKETRGKILSVLSPIEACIDFPEEDVPEAPRQRVEAEVRELAEEVRRLLDGASSGRILREGFCAVIAGKPNVGKSSLLNALLREGRAIVTEIPGTTRDTIEEWADIAGVPVKLVDTAGIRSTSDAVERIGIARSREALAKGDVLLLVLDRSATLDESDLELLELAKEKSAIVILNKMDLNGPLAAPDIEKIHGAAPVCLSLLRNEGLSSLHEKIREAALGCGSSGTTPLVTHLRHQEALERAYSFLSEAQETLKKGFPLDLVALDLRGASEAIGEITGEHYSEDLIRKIFSEFCIGK